MTDARLSAESRDHAFQEAGFDTCGLCGERKAHPDHWLTGDAAQPAPEPVKDDLPLTEVVARLRAIVADHGGLMHEIEPVDAILCPDCGANLAAEHHKSGWCPSVGVLPRSSAGTGDVDRVARAICLAEFGDETKHGDARCCQVGGKDGCCLDEVRPVAQAAIAAMPTEPQSFPVQLTGEIACILEDCSPPEKQTPEALTALIEGYQPIWDRIRSALSRPEHS